MASQLQTWEGEFGDAYTERNAIDWRARLEAFRQMLKGLELQHILEVGCNRGHNLVALAHLFDKGCELTGIDPNEGALDVARRSNERLNVLTGSAYDIPFGDGAFDMAFTAGVLIHLPIESLPAALSEIYRVSSRYILALEYWSEEETPIRYRGLDELLWKRDYLDHYVTQFPDLTLVRSGYWGSEDGFDRTHWWLLQKP